MPEFDFKQAWLLAKSNFENGELDDDCFKRDKELTAQNVSMKARIMEFAFLSFAHQKSLEFETPLISPSDIEAVCLYLHSQGVMPYDRAIVLHRHSLKLLLREELLEEAKSLYEGETSWQIKIYTEGNSDFRDIRDALSLY